MMQLPSLRWITKVGVVVSIFAINTHVAISTRSFYQSERGTLRPLVSLRGGGNERDDTEDGDGGKEKEVKDSWFKKGKGHSLWGAFQMSMDAKEELLEDSEDEYQERQKKNKKVLASSGGGAGIKLKKIGTNEVDELNIGQSVSISPVEPLKEYSFLEEEKDAEDEDVIEFEGVLDVSGLASAIKESDPNHDIPVGGMDGFEREGKQEGKSDKEITSQTSRKYDSQQNDDQSTEKNPTQLVQDEWKMMEENDEEFVEVSSSNKEFSRTSSQLKEKDKRSKPARTSSKKKGRHKKSTKRTDRIEEEKNKMISPEDEGIYQSMNDDSNIPSKIPVMESQQTGVKDDVQEKGNVMESPHLSSGMWPTIDKITSFGFSTSHTQLRLSRKLRPVRKKLAAATGCHGLFSGKGRTVTRHVEEQEKKKRNEEMLGNIRRRLAAIEAARERLREKTRRGKGDEKRVSRNYFSKDVRKRRGVLRLFRQRRSGSASDQYADELLKLEKSGNHTDTSQESIIGRTFSPDESSAPNVEVIDEILRQRTLENRKTAEEDQRRERVTKIDHLIHQGQKTIEELQCEKDYLQRRPNPLYNYTSSATDSSGENSKTMDTTNTSQREFNFPSSELVQEYIDELVTNRRLIKLNHTFLWKLGSHMDEDDENESIGDDLLTPSADVRKLYENVEDTSKIDTAKNNERRNGNNVGGGSWLLRQTLGKGGSLGEKIGEAAENQSAQDLPPVSRDVFGGEDYAQETIRKVIRKGSKRKKRKKHKSYHYGHDMSEDTFIQRDAVVETLISHCQISAPLLKLFPLAWQRAIIGNIITLITAIVSDFCDGMQFQILGHQLSFCFKPITEADMIQHIGVGGFRFNHRRANPKEFEAAVRATAQDISGSLAFLDRWHQRALGGDMLRAQIANLISRIVLTLVDEVLSGARMDLWSSQVGGPRMVAALEYRTNLSNDNSV